MAVGPNGQGGEARSGFDTGRIEQKRNSISSVIVARVSEEVSSNEAPALDIPGDVLPDNTLSHVGTDDRLQLGSLFSADNSSGRDNSSFFSAVEFLESTIGEPATDSSVPTNGGPRIGSETNSSRTGRGQQFDDERRSSYGDSPSRIPIGPIQDQLGRSSAGWTNRRAGRGNQRHQEPRNTYNIELLINQMRLGRRGWMTFFYFFAAVFTLLTAIGGALDWGAIAVIVLGFLGFVFLLMAYLGGWAFKRIIKREERLLAELVARLRID